MLTELRTTPTSDGQRAETVAPPAPAASEASSVAASSPAPAFLAAGVRKMPHVFNDDMRSCFTGA
eukprot:4270777-Pyramimonas_sp.AAC.1